jgi:hypothetical protein
LTEINTGLERKARRFTKPTIPQAGKNSILVSDKVDIKLKSLKRDKEIRKVTSF